MRTIFSLQSLLLVVNLIGFVAQAGNLKDFAFVELNVLGTVDDKNITVLFNPKEYTVTKSTPWKHHNIQGLDAPTLEFTSGEPYRCQFELFFDRYEEGKSVREITDKIEKLSMPDPKTGKRPRTLVFWGGNLWDTALLEAKTEFVVGADGSLASARVHTTWSAFVSLEANPQPQKPPQFVPLLIEGPNLRVPAFLNDQSVELLRLVDPPTLIMSDKVNVEPSRGLQPKIQFSSGEPYRLLGEIWFDTYDSREDVRKLTEPMRNLLSTDATKRPPTALLTWGTGLAFKGVLESFTLRFTLFLDDGTPVRAVMNTVWKEFSPAEEQLKGNPRH